MPSPASYLKNAARAHRAYAALVIAFISAFGFFHVASAATLSLFPSSTTGTYGVDQVFSVNVFVTTADGEAMNAVSGTVSFQPSMLELVSVEKTGSIVNFWIGDPTYSNPQGQAHFEGGVYNPGFTGSNGKILTLYFRAKSKGSATLSYVSASVLANDGRGTNILEHANPVTISIDAAAPIVQNVTIPAIAIHSSTHPDQNAWYASKSVTVSWQLPAGTTAVRTKVDDKPGSTPTSAQVQPVSEMTFAAEDGVTYFHLQARDADGWGPVSNFKIQIDSAQVNPPAFDHFPRTLTQGDALLVSGTTYPNSRVKLYLKDGRGSATSQMTQSGSDGRFEVTWGEHLPNDTYGITAEVTNAHGLTSPQSPDITVTINPPLYQRVAWPLLNIVTLIILGLTAVALVFLWGWYLMHRVSRFRKKVRAATKRADQRVHAKFKKLEDVVISQVKLLKLEQAKRKLTAQEEKMVIEFGKLLQDTEREIEKEIEEIGK